MRFVTARASLETIRVSTTNRTYDYRVSKEACATVTSASVPAVDDPLVGHRQPKKAAKMSATIYIIEDHPLVQEMLGEFINQIPDLHVCGMAATAREALAQIPTLAVDLVVVDVSLPDMDGIQLVSELHTRQPTLRCLMLSGHQERGYVQSALAAGACGYVAKGNPMEIVMAIHQVLKGEIYLSPTLRAAQPDLQIP
jgi:CheY-like chemotaxis protein